MTEAKIPYEVGRAFFKDTARGQICGENVGMLKILFHVDNYKILGIHCFGAEASEIIHIGQAIMNQPDKDNTVEYFINTTFNYPTMTEALSARVWGVQDVCLFFVIRPVEKVVVKIQAGEILYTF